MDKGVYCMKKKGETTSIQFPHYWSPTKCKTLDICETHTDVKHGSKGPKRSRELKPVTGSTGFCAPERRAINRYAKYQMFHERK